MTSLLSRFARRHPGLGASLCLGVVAGLLLAPQMVRAEDWPTKPIRMIVSLGVGGGTDNLARTMAPFLQEELGQPVAVENRAGAGELLAHNYVLTQPDDGYTIMATTAMPYIAVHMLVQNAKYTIDDFAYINLPRNDYTMIATTKTSPFKTAAQFVDAVRKNPGKLSVGTGAVSGADYINLTLFLKALGLENDAVRIVNYKTNGEARTAILGGQLDVGFIAGLPSVPMADVLDAIMVFNDEKVEPWTNAPAFKEAMAQIGAAGKGQFVAGALGGFVVKASFRDKYPERWKKLVDAFRKISGDPAKVKVFKDRDLWADWFGPEKSYQMVKSTFEAFKANPSLLKGN